MRTRRTSIGSVLFPLETSHRLGSTTPFNPPPAAVVCGAAATAELAGEAMGGSSVCVIVSPRLGVGGRARCVGAGDVCHNFLRRHLTALNICGHASEPQNHQAVCDVEHLLEVVTDQQNSQSLLLEPPHEVENLALLRHS